MDITSQESDSKVIWKCPVEQCDKEYTRKSTLNQHINKNHKDMGSSYIDTSHITHLNKKKMEINSFLSHLKLALERGQFVGATTPEDIKLIEDVKNLKDSQEEGEDLEYLSDTTSNRYVVYV